MISLRGAIRPRTGQEGRMVEHPWCRRIRLGRVLTRRSCRNTALVLSWLVIVAIGGTASAVALNSSTGLGISHAVHDTKPYAMNGAIFRGDISGGTHYCSAGVVDSEGRDLIITAAHCVSGGTTGLYFVPGYHDGQAPYGVWPLGRTTTDGQWDNDQDEDFDVAFVTVQPLGGRRIQDVVGGHTLGVDQSMTQMVRITGYPGSADTPITCANRTTAFGAHQLRINCKAYAGGTSGSPWVNRNNEVVGVIGGYQEGGNTPDISYSAYFDDGVRRLYAQAVAASVT
jgi:V8-like Glu-specific endopeptidase